MTLHYYSPKAYEFARNVLSLPHASTIRAWASSVDCQPGFLDNVIKSIGECVQMKGWMSNVVLIVDAMALYKGTRVMTNKIGITNEKNLDLKIQSAVLEQIGVVFFPSFRTHFYEHRIGHEMDHLSCLLRKISSNYLKMRLKTFGKKYSEIQ